MTCPFDLTHYRELVDAARAGGYDCLELGTRYPELRGALRDLEGALGVALRGFGDLGPAEIAGLTGLGGEDLERSRRREFDEPFVPARPLATEERGRLEALAAARGLRITRGGRFHHLTGANSKGEAARRLLAAYRGSSGAVVSLAAGDGPNDLELLEVVDRAIVVARPDGGHAPELRRALPGATFTRGIGPAGFAEAVLEWLAGG